MIIPYISIWNQFITDWRITVSCVGWWGTFLPSIWRMFWGKSLIWFGLLSWLMLVIILGGLLKNLFTWVLNGLLCVSAMLPWKVVGAVLTGEITIFSLFLEGWGSTCLWVSTNGGLLTVTLTLLSGESYWAENRF